MVEQTKHRSGWPVMQTLKILEIPRSTYQRWRKTVPGQSMPPRSAPHNLYELLPLERRAIREYALQHPEIRHRELAWRMLDEGVCAVSSSSVYRVLREAGLVCRWKPKVKMQGSGRENRPSNPDAQWQTDIKYVRGQAGNYYLLSFMDVYSRYIVHHALLRWMDGQTVSTEAAAALAKLDRQATPQIQSDHGSGFISREFAETLSEFGVTHKKIRPHTPTDNAEIERFHRTLDEKLSDLEESDYQATADEIGRIMDHYNHERLHSSLGFLRPVDYYRGNPEALQAERRRKLEQAKACRKQANLKLRQRMMPWPEAKTVA
ncbi:MAG: DDE-type integrase/transposase/recombinase [Phycisphaerales bacterium]|nr:MAG: DDE-type integrase/transposase/recombinase [Phycisphaerales bacterium]